MAREHPFESQGLSAFRFSSKSKQRDFYEDLIGKISHDEKQRTEWLERQEDYYQRRHCLLFRDTNWPWTGAPDPVMPLIDMMIDALKSVLTPLLLPRRPVDIEATLPGDVGQARSDAVYLNWVLLRRIPDYRRQIIYMLDSVLSQGFNVLKIYWDYRTIDSHRSIDAGRLPLKYYQMLEQERALEVDRRRRRNRVFATNPTNGETSELVRMVRERVAHRIAQDYGVDIDDREELDAAVQAITKALGDKEGVANFSIREVEANFPRVASLDNADCIVPPGTTDLQSSPRVVQQAWLTREQFIQRARDHRWDTAAVKRVLESLDRKDIERPSDKASGGWSGRSSIDRVRGDREGISASTEDPPLRVWEVHFLHEFRKGAPPQKAWTVVQPDTKDGVLKKIRSSPYWHGRWPFAQIHAEFTDQGFHSSRGLGERLDDIDIEVTKNHRARMVNLELMAPSFQYRLGSEIDPDTFTFRPARMFPVITLGDIAPLQVPDRTISYEREERDLLTWAQRYIGSLDAVASARNVSEPRTATEVDALQAQSRTSLSHRGMVIQIDMIEAYFQIWNLLNQYGDAREYEAIIGKPMRRRTAEEIRKSYAFTPIGTVESSDQTLESQRAFARFQVLYGIWTQTGGVVAGTHRIDIVEALLNWLERENVLDARSMIRELTQEERQAIESQLRQMAERQRRADENEPLTKGELRQMARSLPRGENQRMAVPQGTP